MGKEDAPEGAVPLQDALFDPAIRGIVLCVAAPDPATPGLGRLGFFAAAWPQMDMVGGGAADEVDADGAGDAMRGLARPDSPTDPLGDSPDAPGADAQVVLLRLRLAAIHALYLHGTQAVGAFPHAAFLVRRLPSRAALTAYLEACKAAESEAAPPFPDACYTLGLDLRVTARRIEGAEEEAEGVGEEGGQSSGLADPPAADPPDAEPLIGKILGSVPVARLHGPLGPKRLLPGEA